MIVTFIDPLCRNFCPREASVLTEAAAAARRARARDRLGQRQPLGRHARTNFQRRRRALAARARAGAGGPGPTPSSPAVWKPYGVGVEVTKKTIAGVNVREITHTGAAYLIDANGHERALFLYPFTTAEVVAAAQAS